MSSKYFFTILTLFLIQIITIYAATNYCKGGKGDECLSRNKNTLPIYQGKCCIPTDNSSPSCKWIQDPEQEILKENPQYKCGTKIEACNEVSDLGPKQFEKCIFKTVEKPYKCCFVSDGVYNRCMALSMESKKIFKETVAYLRMNQENYQGDFTIECSGKYLSALATLIITFIILM